MHDYNILKIAQIKGASTSSPSDYFPENRHQQKTSKLHHSYSSANKWALAHLPQRIQRVREMRYVLVQLHSIVLKIDTVEDVSKVAATVRT